MTSRFLGLAERAFLPLLAGALVAASLPPLGWWPCAPCGVALLAHLLDGDRWAARFVTGLGAGLGQFLIGCVWALQFTAIGYLALVILQSLFVAVACALTPASRGRYPALVGMLVLAEWARESWPLGGLPLAGSALGQVDGPLVGLARIGGPLLIVAAVACAGAALERLVARRLGSAGALVSLVGLGALCGLAAVAPDGGPPVRTISVVAVQGGGERGVSALQVPAISVLAAQLAATARIARRVQLVIWPEDAVALSTPLATSPERKLLGSIARSLDATFVVGVTSPVGATHFLNEAAVFGPSGRYLTAYEKVHAVPFGEYVPFRSLLARAMSFAAVPRDAIVGHGSGEVTTPAGRLALLISFETFFSDRGRSGVRAGGELLVVPTNTASYGSSQIPTQEVAASQLQAVAEGRDLVQVASTGVSAVIDPRGTVLQRSPLGSATELTARVALRTGATLYQRSGSDPVLVIALLATGTGWLTASRSNRRRLAPGSTRARASRTGLY